MPRKTQKHESTFNRRQTLLGVWPLLFHIITCAISSEYASTASLNSWTFVSRWGRIKKNKLSSAPSQIDQPNRLKLSQHQQQILTDTDASSKARMNLSVWLMGERTNSVRPPRNILWETMSQVAQTSLWTLESGKKILNTSFSACTTEHKSVIFNSDQNFKYLFGLFCLLRECCFSLEGCDATTDL